jgi:hypothetical protein
MKRRQRCRAGQKALSSAELDALLEELYGSLVKRGGALELLRELT